MYFDQFCPTALGVCDFVMSFNSLELPLPVFLEGWLNFARTASCTLLSS